MEENEFHCGCECDCFAKTDCDLEGCADTLHCHCTRDGCPCADLEAGEDQEGED